MTDPVDRLTTLEPDNGTTGRRLCVHPRYAVKQPPADPSDLRAVAIQRSSNKWMNGTVLHFCFIDRNAWDWPEAQKAVVREAFAVWKQAGLGLTFREVADQKDAEILIGRLQDGQFWSWVGTDILKGRDRGRNMNFGWDLTSADGLATALHQIGHVLGLEHEHQNPLSGIEWDVAALYDEHHRLDGWDAETTYANVIARLPSNTVPGAGWDPASIMHFPFRQGIIKSPELYAQRGVDENRTLSRTDIEWAQHWYPPSPMQLDPITPMDIAPLPAVAGAQRDFLFEPSATRDYTLQTVGPLDSRLVLFEERDDEPHFVAAADDVGSGLNAAVTHRLIEGRRYHVRVRVHFAGGDGPIGLLVH